MLSILDGGGVSKVKGPVVNTARGVKNMALLEKPSRRGEFTRGPLLATAGVTGRG